MQLSSEIMQGILQGVSEAVVKGLNSVPVGDSSKPVEAGKKYKGRETDGFIQLPSVQAWLASINDDKTQPFFCFPSVYTEIEFPNNVSRLAYRQNLANRNHIIFGQRLIECKPLLWTEVKKVHMADIPWDEPSYWTFQYGDFWVPDSFAWGWDDKDVDEAFILKWYQEYYKTRSK